MERGLTPIDVQIGKGQQDVVYTEILGASDGARLRVSIRSDFYPAQCHARIARWSGEKWHLVHGIHYSKMGTRAKLTYQDGPMKPQFKADRDALVRVALSILGLAGEE